MESENPDKEFEKIVTPEFHYSEPLMIPSELMTNLEAASEAISRHSETPMTSNELATRALNAFLEGFWADLGDHDDQPHQ